MYIRSLWFIPRTGALDRLCWTDDAYSDNSSIARVVIHGDWQKGVWRINTLGPDTALPQVHVLQDAFAMTLCIGLRTHWHLVVWTVKSTVQWSHLDLFGRLEQTCPMRLSVLVHSSSVSNHVWKSTILALEHDYGECFLYRFTLYAYYLQDKNNKSKAMTFK